MKNFTPVSARSVRIGLFLIALVAVAGCVLKPKGGGPPPPPPFQYPALTTPESTLINVKYAWERRDSTRTKLIYRDDYQGASTDQTDGSGTLTYTKDQEVAVVWAMGQRSQILANGVKMDLKPATWIRLRYPADPPGVTAIQITGVNIQVDDAEFGTQVANSSSFFEFKFWPTVDSTSPTDTTWQVYRWTETR